MLKGLQPVNWKMAGALLAQADDNAQHEFFQAFVKECLSWGTTLQVEQQLAYVNNRLTLEERDTLKMLTFMDDEV